MPSVKSTRLRRSGIRKILRNFSSIIGYPLQGLCRPSISATEHLTREWSCLSLIGRPKSILKPEKPGAPSLDFETWETDSPKNSVPHPFAFFLAKGWETTKLHSRRNLAARQHSLAAGLFDLLHGRLRKLVRVNSDGRGQLPRAQNLDQRLLVRG